MLLIVSVPGVEKGKNSVLCTELLDLLSVVFDFHFELKFGYRGFVDFGPRHCFGYQFPCSVPCFTWNC